MVANMPQPAQAGNHITASRRSVRTSATTAPIVLIVEDHEDTRLLYRYLLEGNGCRVIEAADGEEAISKAQSNQPDIILMDSSLPHVDGLTATVRIRMLESLRAVPIIFCSGHAQPQARDAALATGATEYLIKPVLIEELELAIRRHLRDGLHWNMSEQTSERIREDV